jgi:ribosomal protein S18 acetylase RimI-like enzyme
MSTAGPIIPALERIRRVSTNFYASPEQVQNWAAQGKLSWVERADCLLIFCRSSDFHRVYHVAESTEALSGALASNPFPKGPLVADLIGRQQEIDLVARVYEETCGFRKYTTLIRMVRIMDDSPADGDDAGVILAEPADVPAIRAFLIKLLDRFADQIPEEDELESAVARKNILIVRQSQGLGGLLIFDQTGLTITLRYWYVNPRFRGQGIGARLMKTFFRISRGARRIVLWVVSDNTDSIEKYQHYGFRRESLMDQIMIKKNTIEEVLKEIRPEFDFTASDDFISDGMLDSHDVVTLVADLDRAYGISIAGIDIVPENFQNIAAIEQLLRKYAAAP